MGIHCQDRNCSSLRSSDSGRNPSLHLGTRTIRYLVTENKRRDYPIGYIFRNSHSEMGTNLGPHRESCLGSTRSLFLSTRSPRYMRDAVLGYLLFLVGGACGCPASDPRR